MFDLALVQRTERSRTAAFMVPFIAVGLTLVCGTILLSLIGKSPAAVVHSFFIQPLSSLNGIGEILLKAGPLILIAQGLAIGYRANVWNIGAEGQLIVGAIAGGTLAVMFETSDSIFLLPAMMLAGAAAGAAWAGIAAFLRVRFSASEILTSFMLSSVALQLLYYVVSGPLRDPMGMNFPQSVVFGSAALFDQLIPGTRSNTSLFVGLTATVLAWFFMSRTIWGFRLVVGGLAPDAARYAGYSSSRAIWISLAVGGACAGLAGVGEVAGPLGMLQRNLSPGYGYAGIIVAFLGGLHPVGIVFAALLMALLYVGGDFAVVSAGVPNASATILMGMLLVFYLAASLLFTHRIVRRKARVAA